MSHSVTVFLMGAAALLLAFGFVISLANSYSAKHSSGELKRVTKLLPGMNCGQCGFPGCEAYAKSLLSGSGDITLCRPGGPDLVETLSGALGVPAQRGEDYDEQLLAPRQVAFIHPSGCYGCAKCVRACKADAIEGAPKQPHSVRPEWCIGCGDCVKACPEECIEMVREAPSVRRFNWEIKSVQIAPGRR